MFTGLILGTGEVKRVERLGVGAQLTVEPRFEMEQLQEGDSVAVDGTCLTVVNCDKKAFTADVSLETLGKTIVGLYRRGNLVNLELALRMTDRLGGHLVTGHIDGIGVLKGEEKVGESWKLDITLPEGLAPFLIEKGSIAINGISLTVNTFMENTFSVNIVPYTLEKTTISRWRTGDKVNIEMDIIGKYVARFLQKGEITGKGKKHIDRNFLAQHGFL